MTCDDVRASDKRYRENQDHQRASTVTDDDDDWDPKMRHWQASQ